MVVRSACPGKAISPARLLSVFLTFVLSLFIAQTAMAQSTTVVGTTSGKIGVTPSGGASYSVPIAVPVGTTGVQPKIALQYNSQGGNGLLGVGWSVLGQSTITRCATDLYFDAPSKGGVGIDPVDYDDNDKFCLNGERMMALSGTYGADGTEYRTAFESFSKIISHGNTGGSPTAFTVYRKSGEIFTYGTSNDSRVIGQNQTKVRTWALKRITDVKGNYVQFHYHNDKATGEFYITKIDYTGNDAQGLVPYNRIDFVYESRPDIIKANMQGDTVQISKRLKNVKVYAENNLFHDYRLSYGTGATGRSRITSIQQCANDTTCFKPTVFNWSADGGSGFSKSTSAQGIKITAWNKIYVTGDFNGDGRTDFYTADPRSDSGGGVVESSQFVHLANGDGTFQKVQVPDSDKIINYLSVFASGDFNGDGLTDFYTADPRSEGGGGAENNSQYVHLSKGDGTFIRQVIPENQRIAYARSVFVTGDFNGDGLTDFITADPRSGNSGVEDTTQYVHLAKGNGAFERKELLSAERIVYARSVFVTGDFNGDGLTDFFTADPRSEGGGGVNDNAQYLHISKGDGTFTRTEVPQAQRITHINSVFVTGDFNGDGLTDFLTADPRYFSGGVTNGPQYIHISNGDGSFTKSEVAANQKIDANWHVYATGDFNGDGYTDFFTARPKDDKSYVEDGNLDQFIHYSKGDGTFTKVTLASSQKMSVWHKVFLTGDFNGDSVTDFITADPDGNSSFVSSSESGELFLSSHSSPDRITSITNGHGLNTDIVYKPLTDATVYTKGTGSIYPIQDQTYAAYVVAELKADNGKSGQNTQKYQYSGMRSQLTGFGSLGFEKMIVTDVPTGIVTTSTYSQDWTKHFQGLLVNEKTVAPNGIVLSEKTVNWKVRGLSDPNSVFVSCFRFVESTVTEKRDLNGAFISRVVEKSTYDEFGYPTQMTVTTMNEDGSEAYSKITNNTYTHNAATWRLGRLTDANVVHKGGTVTPVTETNEVTTYTQETQTTTNTETVADENFESSTTGWIDLGGSGGNYEALNQQIIIGSSPYPKVMGKFSNSATSASQTVTKSFTISPDTTQIKLEFDVYEFGGWNSNTYYETGFDVYVNDQLIAPGTSSDGTTSNTSTVTWTGNEYYYGTPIPVTIKRYTVIVPATGTVKIGFGARAIDTYGIFGNSSYEWAIDNFKLSRTYSTSTLVTVANTTTHQTTSWTGDLTATATDHTRTSSFGYDADGLLKPETVEPGSDQSYTKTNNYNAFGAITSITENWASSDTDGVPGSSRTSSYTYDSKIRYKLTETNPLGHSQTNEYHPILGLLTKTTGPNGLSTTFEYDAFGRKTRETRADGTWTESYIEMCGETVSCPEGAVYRTRTVSSAGAEGMVYMDKLNRKIRTRTKVDSQWALVDTVYDSQGRVEKKSESYFEGDATIYWTTITYDLLGRPISTVMADSSTQSVTYNGLTQISTNELGQTKTVVKNIMGQTVQVIDTNNQAITYTYDALGQMITVTGNGKTQTFAYDIRGNKIMDTDPDKGTWTYRYNALGKIVEQTNAKGEVTRMTYDVLGRMLTRIDDADSPSPEQRTSTWTYDTATNGIGKLHIAESDGYRVTNNYDSLGRPSSSTEVIDNSHSLTTTTTYDTQSRPDMMTYPSGLTVKNIYDATGGLKEVQDGATGNKYWQRLEVDARGNITKSLYGNGVETTKGYVPENGRLSSIVSTKSGTAIQNLSYTFDAVGNLTYRSDNIRSQSETFVYDTLNRVTEVNTTVGGTTSTVTMTYGITGNILSKSDIGTYTYGQVHANCASGFAGPHAVTSVSGTKNATYCYDANGNMTSGDGRIISYTAFDKPTRITKGGNTVEFYYGPDRKRFKRIDNTVEKGTVTTIYAAGKAYERIENAQGVTAKHYIGDFAVITQTVNTGAIDVSYLHRDHLGSVETITNSAGVVTQRMSFDAWGKRREVNWQPMGMEAIASFNTNTTNRGFTGHEQIDPVGLIHMNGRVYDAELGRFLSADPHIQALDNLQNFNRYSYVLNNPLSYTDPTGFFFSKLFKAIGAAFGKLFKAIGRAFKKLLRNPIVRAILQITACTFGGPAGCAAAAGIATAAAGGSMADVFKAIAFSFISQAAFKFVGAINGLSKVGRALLHGVVNGALRVAQGGNFAVGFVTGLIGKASSFVSEALSRGDKFLDTLIVAAAGCASSVISGGKCANGAISAAYANLFNKWNGPHAPSADEIKKLRILMQSKDTADRQRVIEKIIEAYKLNPRNKSEIKYVEEILVRGRPVTGKTDYITKAIEISALAFRSSPGYLASVIDHEFFHTSQSLPSEKNEVYQNELDAYNYSLSNAKNYGLTAAETFSHRGFINLYSTLLKPQEFDFKFELLGKDNK